MIYDFVLEDVICLPFSVEALKGAHRDSSKLGSMWFIDTYEMCLY